MEPLQLKDRALIGGLGSGNVQLFLETNLIPQKCVQRMTPAIRAEEGVIVDALHSSRLNVRVMVVWNAKASHIHWIDEEQSVNAYTVVSSMTNHQGSSEIVLPDKCLIGYFRERRQAVRAMRSWAYSEETVSSMFPIVAGNEMYRSSGSTSDIPIIGRDVRYNQVF